LIKNERVMRWLYQMELLLDLLDKVI
jgi:hypothetical protein